MCGIFGYVGKQNDAAQIILKGLKLLEYRGYDSWGIAVKEAGKLTLEKHVGKIGNAETVLPQSRLGIGHTRWATHGGVTVANAHPHLDCTKTIAVVHNGIIENFQELKDDLLKKGHVFLSETDTEILPHLIEENLKKEGFASAVRDTFNTLHGMNAIVALFAPSQEIIAAKNGSPMVVGIGKNELFVASDVSGIIQHTRDVLFLKDHEMVILGKDMQLLKLPNGEKLSPNIETADWKIEDSQKDDFPHFMIKEINEQPRIMRNIAGNYLDQITRISETIKSSRGTFFIGAGTAFHACLAGTYLFSKISHVHVNTAVASEFNYLEDFLTKESLVIALSQSGETIDVIEPLNRAREKGSRIVAIVNALGSSIYRMSDDRLLLNAGTEKAVASTKAYIAKLTVLLLLSYAMIGKVNEAAALVMRAADEIEKLLEEESLEKLKNIVKVLSKSEHIYVIGRGMSYASSLEAALKIKEVSYIHTEGLAGGELKHGTIALISEGTPCIVFAPSDETYDAMISNATEIKARGGIIIGIGTKKSAVFDYWIEIANLKDANILSQIIPAQLLAYYLATRKGLDPDKPRNLAKSVTVK